MAAEHVEGDGGGSLEEKGGGSQGERVHVKDQSDHNEKEEDEEEEHGEQRVKGRRASRGRPAYVTPKQLFTRSGTFSPERVITFPMLLDFVKVRGPG